MKFALEPIYEFVDFSFIYRYAYNTSNDLQKTEEAESTIKAGGLVLHSDIDKFSSKHQNLLNFVLKNKIMIEDFNEYKLINKSFVKIALIRQLQKDTVSLSKTELYSCIKYINYKELRLLFDEYYKTESTKKGKLQITKELRTWLINTEFQNATIQYLSTKKAFNKFEEYIKNIIFILSLSKQDKEDVNAILKIINSILNEGKNSLSIFESINLFLGIQHNLYQLEIHKEFLLNMINTLINKLIYKKFTGHEYIALTRNELSNLYWYARLGKVVLENEELIDRLLTEIKTYPISDQIEITQNFVLNLYEISNNKIKNNIREFALSIKTEGENEIYKKIIFEITLVIFGFKNFSAELNNEIENYLQGFRDGKKFSSILYMLDSQIDYLQLNKNVTGLETISDILKTAIKRYEESERVA